MFILEELRIETATFRDLHLDPQIDDRSLWNLCQNGGWVLLTNNRNREGENSLQATLEDSWRPGRLPVLTLANKGRFEHHPPYAKQTAVEVAEVLFGIVHGDYRNEPRIYLPRSRMATSRSPVPLNVAIEPRCDHIAISYVSPLRFSADRRPELHYPTVRPSYRTHGP